MTTAIKNRTRSEVVAVFRESLRRKQECVQQMQHLMKEIRQEEQLKMA